MTGDPEKLLSEALRAQATRAPADTSPVGYGLLSGSDLPPALRPQEPTHRVIEDVGQVPATLILLLALVLGLAAGAVVGLMTLL
ncbi:hypothetical protein [Actinophytocola oryzae]|uniref:Uncharacterized protein n=1 Tax=Actinophytocola oryzae TaxID=502181 RepID=A0A4R7VN48_9PSEU|nr:hypothetical protein [Actinophytocola oryzae]TDV50689.1 hypothetical protein CLV71_10629 [Actinophytocola oryzae]